MLHKLNKFSVYVSLPNRLEMKINQPKLRKESYSEGDKKLTTAAGRNDLFDCNFYERRIRIL